MNWLFAAWLAGACPLLSWLYYLLWIDWRWEPPRARAAALASGLMIALAWPLLALVCLWGWLGVWRSER